MSKYIGNHPSIEIVQSTASRWDYVNTANPAINTNPDAIGDTWLNLTTGEEFVCIDTTADLNIWVGSLGSIVQSILSFSPLFWWDFSDASTLFTDAGVTNVVSDGDTIYQVNDKSGNAHHLVQTNASYRPPYKVGVQNGLSVARPDGVDDHWLIPSEPAQASTWNFIAVIDTTNIGTDTRELLGRNTDGGSPFGPALYLGKTAPDLYFPNIYWGTDFVHSETAPYVGKYIMSFQGISGTSASIGIDDGALNTTAHSETQLETWDEFCGSFAPQSCGIDVMEAVMFGVLTEQERLSIVSVLSSKWAI